MGGIVLSNYVASYGQDCVLDGAIAVSGGLDMRFQEHFYRAQRLWQPILAETLKSDFLLGKFGKRAHERLSKSEMLRMMRATHITVRSIHTFSLNTLVITNFARSNRQEIDRYAIVPYNSFRDLTDYYSSMSALGDIPLDEEGLHDQTHAGKVHSIAIPLVVVHAFDDPLITWRASAQNEGFMHPTNLTRTGSGNLMLLLTNAGGHVGWPTGLLPMVDKWMWMSNLVGGFGKAISAVKRAQTRTQQA
jgi:predicted alpha/beta-fold hydrolase